MLTTLYPVSSDGYLLISEPRSFGSTGDNSGEEAYAKRFDADSAFTQALVKGLRYLLPEKRYGRVLEIGCGTGILSKALALGVESDELVITDTSKQFLSMTRRRLAGSRQPVVYAILNGDDVDKLPDGYFSIAAFRYVLHHILDWRSFLRNLSQKISADGCILFEEPCVEGFLLQILATALCKADSTDPLVTSNLNDFFNTIMWYLKTEVDKTRSEDKHLFHPDEMFSIFNDLGFLGRFYPNAGMSDVYSGNSASVFIRDFRHNLRGNFGFSDRTIEWFDDTVVPKLSFIEEVTKNSPRVKGVYKFTNVGRPALAPIQ